MPIYHESKVVRVDWGWRRCNTGGEDHANWGEITYNYENCDKKVQEALDKLSLDQWEIKSITPLEASRYYTEGLTNGNMSTSTWGAGYGYGAGYTSGIMIIATRSLNLSDEEYALKLQDYKNKQTAKAELPKAREKLELLAKSLEKFEKENPGKVVSVKTGMFAKGFKVGDQVFDDEDEAKDCLSKYLEEKDKKRQTIKKSIQDQEDLVVKYETLLRD